MSCIINDVRAELIKNSDENTELSSQHFSKEPINAYGVKTSIVRKISKGIFKSIKHTSSSEIYHLCEQLWQSGMLEESVIACDWSYALYKKYEPGDLAVFERWLQKYVSNWAACDTLCNHTIGAFMERFPQCLAELKRWSLSKNRWMRRGAAVTLIVPARKGLFLNDIFEISELLLEDQDDLVQKGYGWLLKSATKLHMEEVFNFIMNHKATMPRTALRYAIEKMPFDLKYEAMKK